MKRIASPLQTEEKCHYGCGQIAKYKNGSGNLMCLDSSNKCPVNRAKNASGVSEAHADGRCSVKQFDGKRNWAKGKRFIPNEKIFVIDSNYSNECLRGRIFADELIPYECECCGLEGTWQGKSITLELDHKNGINNYNILENLRFLCPNCHSQTPTFRGRNINGLSANRSVVTDEAIIEAFNECKNIRQTLIKVGLTPAGGNYIRVKKLNNIV